METENRSMTILLIVAIIGGIAVCLWRITIAAPTANEALLLSLFLTLLSIIGSWIASKYYSESSYNKNIRVFALKAAEKVTNLSNELDRLSAFIQQELKENDYESPAEAALAKNIRLEGAVHIINTLKSVNDRSLSDWQGVIGDEISAQREVQEEREEMLRDLLERFDLLQHATMRAAEMHHDAGQEPLYSEVASIRSELRLLASQISGIPVAPTRVPKKKEIQKPCPSCGQVLQYRQKAKAKNVRAVDCTKCGARLVSREADGDFTLAVRAPIDENVTCPSCGQNSTIPVDPAPGSVLDTDCPKCKVRLRISRSHSGLRIRLPGLPKPTEQAPPLAEEFLKKVAELMGPQPWPKGQALLAAGKLEVNPRLVGRATQELIRRGVFKPQIDGKLYAPERT
jgi:predicted RNA-binding Zn-ribbon protein involved in translation (DUF1610 family)